MFFHWNKWNELFLAEWKSHWKKGAACSEICSKKGSKVVEVGWAQAWHIFGLGQDWREHEGAWIGRENPRNVVFGFRAGAVSVSHCVVVRTGLSSAHPWPFPEGSAEKRAGGEMRTNQVIIQDNSCQYL